jgi:hypothetical protein
MSTSGELPIAAYQPRRTQSLGILERAGWAVKIIGITASGDLPGATEVEAAAKFAQKLLPQPAHTGKRPGAAFLIVHRGAEALWAILGWRELDILYQRLSARTPAQGSSGRCRRTALPPVSGNCSPSTMNGNRGSRTCCNDPLTPTLPGTWTPR